jgi:putative tricarboxylic transport membrane protein
MDNLILGFTTALSYQNIIYCFLGVLLGTFIGVLPGLGPLATISILFPITYNIGDPTTSIIFLAGIYYGSQYGGSTTAILLKLPGEPSSIVTSIDGYELTKKGRSGSALCIAAVGSFIAGTFGTMIIGIFAEPLSQIAIKFSSADYTALMFLGCLGSVFLTQNSLIKSSSMMLLGILFGLIGIDTNTGVERFTFGEINLANGISFVVMVIGLIGLVEIIKEIFSRIKIKIENQRLSKLYPSKQEAKDSVFPIIRGSLIGSILGMLPGMGSAVSSLTSYMVEKAVSKNPKKFGKGAIEAVAGPESANNAAAQTGFVPALGLGIPTNPVMALMIGAFYVYGIQPGPYMISGNPSLFWGLVVSMWIGNLILLILNLPLIRIWVSILKIPRYILFPFIIIVCLYGTYSINNNFFDVWLLIPFVLLGLLFYYTECDPAPLIMGFILGPMLEENLRRTLIISHGDWSVFLNSYPSLIILTLMIIIISVFLIKKRI